MNGAHQDASHKVLTRITSAGNIFRVTQCQPNWSSNGSNCLSTYHSVEKYWDGLFIVTIANFVNVNPYRVLSECYPYHIETITV